MCFAFFDVLSLIVIDLAALLSLSRCWCVLRMLRLSCAAVPSAHSSDSDESAIVACAPFPSCIAVYHKSCCALSCWLAVSYVPCAFQDLTMLVLLLHT